MDWPLMQYCLAQRSLIPFCYNIDIYIYKAACRGAGMSCCEKANKSGTINRQRVHTAC